MKYKILIVSANYYDDISKSLIRDVISTLDKANIKHETILVPGVFEIPVIIAKNIKKYNGFIALGCVIKGETPHFDFISQSTMNGLISLSVNNKKPIGNGIITCLNKKQAIDRSMTTGKKILKNKGFESANAVLELLNVSISK